MTTTTTTAVAVTLMIALLQSSNAPVRAFVLPAFRRSQAAQDVSSPESVRRNLSQPHSRRHLRCVQRLFGAAAGDNGFRTTTTLPPVPDGVHRVVFMRHGESEFNNANIFTGWCDVALTRRGVVEAIEAGQVFRSHEMAFRKCYTSLLTRSIVTAHRALEEAGISYTPLQYEWRLNERHYGALQGLSKERTAVRLGRETVMKWRRSYEAQPPLMKPEHPHYDTINNDPRYGHLQEVPLGESLEDCQKRVVAAWEDIVAELTVFVQQSGTEETAPIRPELDANQGYSLVVAHANSLRALVMHLDDIGAEEIESLNIPTAIPFFYDIDLRTGRVIDSSLMSQHPNGVNGNALHSPLPPVGPMGKFRGIYISDERKQRSFLERRRAANDPWLWALHDEQVDASMLLTNGGDNADRSADDPATTAEGLAGLEEEARQNTELFSRINGSSSSHQAPQTR